MQRLSKNRLSQLRKFRQKKVRRSTRMCLIEGEKLIGEALRHGIRVETLVYATGSGKAYRELLEHPLTGESLHTDAQTLKKLSGMESPQDAIGLIELPAQANPPGGDPKHSRYLALDRIADPNNLGAIVRTVSWYGWDGILCSKGTAELLNDKVVRASMGAAFHLPVWEDIDLAGTLGTLREKNFTVFCAVPRGGGEPEPADRTALVIGSESHGVDPAVLKQCDGKVTIPGFGKAESLNAAVSAGILMDRFSRVQT